MGDTIGVLYSCHLCGIENVEVAVRMRKPEEDVIKWMNGVVIVRLGLDHHSRSPHCRPDKLWDVKIPVPEGTKFIGGPVEQ